jgi:hypothetical protein
MSFLPVVTVIDTPLDGKSVKILDATGTVGVLANTTGYGQAGLPQTAPVIYGFLGKLLSSLTWSYNILMQTADAVAFTSTGMSLTSLLFGTGLTQYPDGVLVCQMLAYTDLGTYTISPDGKTITTTAANAINYINDGYTHVTILAAGLPIANVHNLAIDVAGTIALNNVYTILLLDAAPTTVYTALIAKPAIFRFLELATGNQCIVRSIAALTEDNVEENAQEVGICKLIQWQLSGKINFSCKEYGQAHDTIVSLNLKCGAGCTSC